MNFQKMLMTKDAHAIETQCYLENLEIQKKINVKCTKYELLKHIRSSCWKNTHKHQHLVELESYNFKL